MRLKIARAGADPGLFKGRGAQLSDQYARNNARAKRAVGRGVWGMPPQENFAF